MNISIVVYSAPYSSQAAWSAYRFTSAAIEQGHTISRLFFYYDGVHNTNSLSTPAQNEFDLVAAWQRIISAHNIDTVSCVSSALKRGIINAQEAQRYEKECANLIPESELSGLGQLIDTSLNSDRVVSFGA